MKFQSLVFAVLFGATVHVHAEVQSITEQLEREASMIPQDWKPFLGLSTGYMGGTIQNTEGFPANIKLIGSFYAPTADWVADGGLGLLFQATRQERSILVPMLEGSWRYRWASGWQLGPVLNTFLGDSGRFGSANDNVTSMIGASLLKEFRTSDYLWRAGVAAMTDMDIRGEQVNSLTANLQVTFGGEKRRSAAVEASEVIAETPRPAEHLIERARMSVFNNSIANFSVNTSTLTPSGKMYLNKLAAIMKNPKYGIQKINLVGHCDITGPEKLNRPLSIARARVAKNYLVSKGVPKAKIDFAGHSSLEPLSETDNAPNRRVELKLISVKDRTQAEAALQAIR